MAEVLLDTKFWNKVFKILKPATVVAVKKNKGAGGTQFIPSNGSENLSKSDNKSGFFYRFKNRQKGKKYFAHYSKQESLAQVKMFVWKNGLTEVRVKEIEKAIVQVAVAES